MKQVYKICTACLGEGVVESSEIDVTKVVISREGVEEEPTEKRGNVKCYVCNGKTIVPSGFFILEEGDYGRSILDIIETLPEDIKKAILNRT